MDNLHAVVLHQHFISNIHIQVPLTPKNQLFHNLVRVTNCEITRNCMTLGTFGLPPSGRTLGRYPFHHTERTLEVYMSLCHKHSTLPRMSLSSVACEGSHVRNFGRLVVESTLYPPPFQGVVPTQHSSTLGLGPYCGLTVH